MLENQDIEFKTIWKDEYLKWVCGMANANGGIIYIGLNDEGKIVGKGTHEELLKTCPTYYEIASSQLSKEEL